MSWQDEVGMEQEVVRAFLAMPACPLKEALGRLVLRVAADVENLRCAGAQGDGFPCPELESDCVTCRGWERRLRECV